MENVECVVTIRFVFRNVSCFKWPTCRFISRLSGLLENNLNYSLKMFRQKVPPVKKNYYCFNLPENKVEGYVEIIFRQRSFRSEVIFHGGCFPWRLLKTLLFFKTGFLFLFYFALLYFPYKIL